MPLQRSFTRRPRQLRGTSKVRSYVASCPFSTSKPCITHSPGTSIGSPPLNVQVPDSGTRSVSTFTGNGESRGTTTSALTCAKAPSATSAHNHTNLIETMQKQFLQNYASRPLPKPPLSPKESPK